MPYITVIVLIMNKKRIQINQLNPYPLTRLTKSQREKDLSWGDTTPKWQLRRWGEPHCRNHQRLIRNALGYMASHFWGGRVTVRSGLSSRMRSTRKKLMNTLCLIRLISSSWRAFYGRSTCQVRVLNTLHLLSREHLSDEESVVAE